LGCRRRRSRCVRIITRTVVETERVRKRLAASAQTSARSTANRWCLIPSQRRTTLVDCITTSCFQVVLPSRASKSCFHQQCAPLKLFAISVSHPFNIRSRAWTRRCSISLDSGTSTPSLPASSDCFIEKVNWYYSIEPEMPDNA
jgi:hypothetical protein